jgi:hypothetical protein
MSLDFGRDDDTVAAPQRVVLDLDNSEIPYTLSRSRAPTTTTSSSRPHESGHVQGRYSPVVVDSQAAEQPMVERYLRNRPPSDALTREGVSSGADYWGVTPALAIQLKAHYPLSLVEGVSAYPSDSSDALQVQNGDSLAPGIYNFRAPPLSKNSAYRGRRGARHLCQILAERESSMAIP